MLNSSLYLALVNLSSNIIGFICAVKSNCLLTHDGISWKDQAWRETERRQMQVPSCVDSLYWKKQQQQRTKRTTKGSSYMSHVEMHSVSVICIAYLVVHLENVVCAEWGWIHSWASMRQVCGFLLFFLFSVIQV